MDISIHNCNNIDSGDIHIENGRLNIKYAINGTGKSTITQAISLHVSGEALKDLRPFKYSNDEDEAHNPSVMMSDVIQKVAIFDEKFIEKYAYKKDELVANSFEIFVKTLKYEEHMRKISESISSIQNAFRDDPDLDALVNDLTTFIESFGKTQSGYSKAGDLGKTIGKGNKIENVPSELVAYAPYLRAAGINLRWLKWQTEGKDYLEITDKCPYCVSSISTPKETILKIGQEYDIKYLSSLIKMLDVFTSLEAYFSENTKLTIQIISKNATGITKDQIDFLKRLKDEITTLRDKLTGLKSLGFASLSNVDRVADALRDKIIDLAFYRQLESDYTKSKINRINDSLNEVITAAGQLQGQVAQQKEEIRRTIENHSNDINGFLESAGYQYKVSIVQPGGENYRLILTYTEHNESIGNVKEHLSYGERNAFALVLFMYQTIKENADFIVLDDPISSFDNNKKFAIMSTLFRGTNSLQGKTVLMLTHDFEPIIDIVCTLRDIFSPPAKAHFISNINGKLNESLITNADVKSCVSVCESNIANSADIIHKLIHYRRLVEINDQKNIVWDLLSNVFHKNRDIPQIKDKDGSLRDMTSEEIELATSIIQQKINDFNYPNAYARTKNIPDMVALYRNSASGYEKVQIYRMLKDGDMRRGSAMKKYVDETFHVQNDYLFQLNPRQYEIVPQYVLNYCDDAICIIEQNMVDPIVKTI
ncbi:AAA family ATPase [Aminirod propionatiphilus]|uniref:AAA family ATPase n=1 Tax=Aminirod propionatiphilus TaxID=3415223 RepID=A0ACD1DX92_9BACT|nr:AAA family ATPase [Synergistota bacterium]